MNNEIMVTQSLAIDYANREVVQTLKATVAQGLNEPEFRLFVDYCKSTGLNPFKKEVWAIKAGGRLQIMTGINGFLTIANKNPMFDGLECSVDDDENPTKAICKVYRKDRKYPSEGVAMIKEYYKKTPIWDQMPRVMLTKVAKSIALREAFPQELGSLYAQEEMPPEYRAPSVEVIRPAAVPVQAVADAVYEPETEVNELPEASGEVYYYKLWPKMDGFDVWKAKIKQAGGIWNAEHKNWSVKAKIPGLERQEMTANGDYVLKNKKPEAKKPIERVETVDDVKFDEAPPFDDDDLPF